MKKVGVLALQGDFEAHGKAIERAGVRDCDGACVHIQIPREAVCSRERQDARS